MRIYLLLFINLLTFDSAVALTQSDGYNIGVVLGSIVAALLVIGIAGFIFYMCCVRKWLGKDQSNDLPYLRQSDYTGKKQAPRHIGPGRGQVYTLGAATRDNTRGSNNDQYEAEEDYTRRQQSHTTSKAQLAYSSAKVSQVPQGRNRNDDSGDSEPPVKLSGSSGKILADQSRISSNISYSSESDMVGARMGTGQAYHQRVVTAHATTVAAPPAGRESGKESAGGSPSLPVAYLGTGV